MVFENAEHDFPQRILYWRDDDQILHARIEGELQGELQAQPTEIRNRNVDAKKKADDSRCSGRRALGYHFIRIASGGQAHRLRNEGACLILENYENINELMKRREIRDRAAGDEEESSDSR